MFVFQLSALVIRYLLLANTNVPRWANALVAERSPFSDEIFFGMNASYCSKQQRKDYRNLADVVKSKLEGNYGFYFLESQSPQQLLHGIRARGRPGEERIDEAYLARLESEYARFKKRVAPLSFSETSNLLKQVPRQKSRLLTLCCFRWLCLTTA